MQLRQYVYSAMDIQAQYRQPARRRRAQSLTVEQIIAQSAKFDQGRPKARILSGPNDGSEQSTTWRANVLRVSAAIAAAAALVVASQQLSPRFLDNPAPPTGSMQVVDPDAVERTEFIAPHVLPELLAPLKVTDVQVPAFSMESMTLSNAYIEKLKIHEGLRLTSYLDNGAGSTWTIGYGHTGLMPDGREIGPNMTITEEEAEALLKHDLQEHVDAVKLILGNTPVTQGQFESLVDFSFNKGPHRLESSTLLKKFLAADVVGAADEYLRWTKITRRDAQGNPVLDARGRRIMDEMPGLVARAKDKREQMLSGFPEHALSLLDDGVGELQLTQSRTMNAEKRLRPIQVASSRADRNILMLDKTAQAVDKHITQLEKQMLERRQLIDGLQQQAHELKERFKTVMKAAGKHTDAKSDAWRGVVDLANQAHVLDHVAATQKAQLSLDKMALAQYQRQANVLHDAASALSLGAKLSKHNKPEDASHAQEFDEAIDQLFNASHAISELADNHDADLGAKSLLDPRHSQRLAKLLETQGNALNDRLDAYQSERIQRELTASTAP